MMLMPTVVEERARTLRDRVRSWREDGLVTAETERTVAARLTTHWREYGLFASLLFFFLTACAVAAFFGLLATLELPKVIAGLTAIVVAELLIAKGWFGTGVESALWLCGLFALIASLPSEGKPEALLVFAAAAAIAGLRVRNPFFGALAAILVVSYLAVKDWRLQALSVALTLAAVALVALAREWRRPSTEWLWICLVIAMPIAAYAAGDPGQAFQLPLFFGVAVVMLAAGIRMRHHAPLVASAIAFVIFGGEWFESSAAPLELLLAVSGAVLLAIAFALSKALHHRTLGFVTTPTRLTRADDAIELLSVLAAAPHETSDVPPGRPQGDGGFGGAGATGDY